jgi:uncharacterized repeat protein (TIGR04138 family)
MQPLNFEESLEQIVAKNPRYHHDAYVFMREALEYTQGSIGKSKKNEIRHVSGNELLEGVRKYAIEQFGPMVPTVFSEWGIRSCEDFGELVFLMIENNILAKTEQDSRDDFKAGYNFYDAFCKPYLPSSKVNAPQPKSVKV